jgi:hypothetical protein
MMEESGQAVEVIRDHYVYELYDRRTGQVFYVGEGVRDRAEQHVKDAKRIVERLREDPSLAGSIDSQKLTRIVGILEAGAEHLGVRVIGRFDSKHEAQAVETVLINWVYGLGDLTNVSRGRGADYIREKARATDELPGIDIGRRLRVFGQRKGGAGYLQRMLERHERHGHLSMAEDIAAHLKREFPQLAIEEPCFWENGRYVAVFVTVVPDAVRMIVQLTDSGKHRHVYNLKAMSERQEDVRKFEECIEQHRLAELALKNGGRYAKLPEWQDLRVSNLDWPRISVEVRRALAAFGQSVAAGTSV